MSAVISVILITVNMIPAFIFADYHGRPLTGEYEVKEDSIILIDESRVEEFENDGSYREVPVHFYYPDDADIRKSLSSSRYLLTWCVRLLSE